MIVRLVYTAMGLEARRESNVARAATESIRAAKTT